MREGLERVEIGMCMAETGGSCDGCVLGTGLWNIYTPHSVRSQVCRRLIHADANGPLSVKSLQGAQCCVYLGWVQQVSHGSVYQAKQRSFLVFTHATE